MLEPPPCDLLSWNTWYNTTGRAHSRTIISTLRRESFVLTCFGGKMYKWVRKTARGVRPASKPPRLNEAAPTATIASVLPCTGVSSTKLKMIFKRITAKQSDHMTQKIKGG